MSRELIDATQQQVGQPGVVEMPSDSEPRLVRPSNQQVDGFGFKNKVEEIAFMNEDVIVTIHPTNDKNQENPVPLGNDGRMIYVPRGVQCQMKRRYVEVLARAKADSFGDQEYVNDDGVRAHRYPKNIALKYPFSVNEDKNPNGAAWLKKVLAEAN